MVDSDDLYGPMEVDDDLSTGPDTEILVDRDMVPPWLRQHPGFLGRHPTYPFAGHGVLHLSTILASFILRTFLVS